MMDGHPTPFRGRILNRSPRVCTTGIEFSVPSGWNLHTRPFGGRTFDGSRRERAQLAQDTQPATQTTTHQDGSQTPLSHDQDDTATATANITSELPGNKFQECFGEVDRNCNPQPCFSTSSRSTKDYRQKQLYSLCYLYAFLSTMRATAEVNLRVL